MPEEPEEEGQKSVQIQPLLSSEWIKIQGVVFTLMTLIGLSGVPDDLAQWRVWLEGLLDRGPTSYALIFVGSLGLMVLYYPRLWKLGKRVVKWFQKPGSPLDDSDATLADVIRFAIKLGVYLPIAMLVFLLCMIPLFLTTALLHFLWD